MSKDRLLCDGWEFAKTPLGTEYSDRLEFEPVDIPHDWLIYDTENLYEDSTGWYRRQLTYQPDGNRRSIRFEGVYMDCQVFVNKSLAGEWKYGYTTFEFDITDLLKEGENLITVCVNHHNPNSRWYSGAGIYRRVWLKSYPEFHILKDGVYISSDISGDVTISVEAERPGEEGVSGYSIRNRIIKDGHEVAVVQNACLAAFTERIPASVRREGCQYSINVNNCHVSNVKLWDIDDPQLYICVTELLKDGTIIDAVENTFGFRKIEFTTDRGFFLNGRHVKLHGCCEHHDLGALGSAVNQTAIRRKLFTLKTIGINAIRTSHNPPAVEFMEAADEMGMLILSEGFDMWEMPKTTYDYARFFKEWAQTDVDSWVRRDRNHPSIIGWSIGNEIYDTHASEHGMEIASMLAYYVRRSDWRDNGYITQGSNFMQWDNAKKCADILKLAGYNYAERLYDSQHEEHPDWMIYGSETSSVVQSRGIYHFPLSKMNLCDDDEQCSALGNTTPAWAAKSTEACIIPDRDREFVAGQFIWTGFDYIGEPTPYSTKNSYFGQFDTAGFIKDSAYIFKAAWTDYKKAPFVHVYPYWDFSEGQDIDIRVASNAPRVALFFNGRKVREESFDRLHGATITMDTVLPYSKGELLAVAYDENGIEIARDKTESFTDAVRLAVTPDKTSLKADGLDMIFVTITVLDEKNRPVENANNRVEVSVSGAGRLVGLDNGDSTDYDSYKGTSRRLFSGKLLAMIASKTEPGEVKLRVSSAGMEDVCLTLNAEASDMTEGISANTENKPSDYDKADIPVRRIDFSCDTRTFSPERKIMKIKTVVYPANASYAEEIDYRITTILGIDVNTARILSVDDGVITMECLGDGEFYLRALCKNGTDKYHILNSVRFCGEGLGSACYDPYSFVAGGLYTISGGSATNGIERGAAFSNGYGYAGYENVDFGRYGSDTITIPIFANCTTPVSLQVYDGVPGEGGELIGELTYFKPPIWLTYQPETWKLNKKLKGIHTITIASSDGLDFGGFSFERPVKECMEISVLDRDDIYGDSFTVEKDAITGIGNNVVIDFGEFDFSEAEPAAVVICGRSELPVNSIHVCFEGDTQKRVLAEFEGIDVYTEREFSLEGITGRCRVSFTFLPGCRFDFKSFRFISKR